MKSKTYICPGCGWTAHRKWWSCKKCGFEFPENDQLSVEEILIAPDDLAQAELCGVDHIAFVMGLAKAFGLSKEDLP